MAFPKSYAGWAARWRVAAGFAVAAAFLLLARPTEMSLGVGFTVGAAGVWLRAWAAGHLAKYESLAVTGPYAHTRNPLFLGTLLAGIGFSVAGAHAGIGILLAAFFVFFYLPAIEEEEGYLLGKFPGYREYRERVPRLWPKWRPQYPANTAFQFRLYARNREYQALAGYLLGMAVLAVKSCCFP